MDKIVRCFAFIFLLTGFGFNSNASGINSFNPIFYSVLANNIDVRNLGTEINGEFCEFPMSVSEINSGLIYCVDYKTGANSGSRDFVFSAYDSASMTWSYPVSISTEFTKFLQENQKMNYQNIFVTIDNDIYMIDFLSKKDFFIQKLNINSKNSYEANASVSSDGLTLYFVSDRKGGFGGKDIYASERLSNGNWSEPYNLGPQVNTEFDEETPFIMKDGVTLYFSSKGHQSIGGFDVFYTTLSDEGLWSEVESVGEPLNTKQDDMYFITDSYGKRGFYASDKLEKGNFDIYSVIYP